jgi:hypothetical protein
LFLTVPTVGQPRGKSQFSILFAYAGCPGGDLHDGEMLVRAPIRDQSINVASSWSHCRCIVRAGTGAVWAAAHDLPPSDLAEMVAV